MIRLLMVGSQLPMAIESHYYNHLRNFGIEVSFFNSALFYKVESVIDKIKFRYWPDQLFRQVNVALIDSIENDPPDMVWIFKGLEFFPETLKRIKERGILLLNYNPDHPFIRTFVSNGGRHIEESVPLYDVHFCYSKELTLKIQSDFNLKSFWLPFGYDLTDQEFGQLQLESEINRVCFVGNPDHSRANTIKRIAHSKQNIDVYGYNWKRFLKANDQIRIFDQVLNFDYWRTLRKYRLQLNVFRPHNFNSHNMRTFEIPACGGIQAAPSSDENKYFFEAGKEIYLFRNDEELISVCDLVINMSAQEANQVRINSRSRVVSNRDSYQNSAQYVADIMKSL
jgi:spore maturation protein CgeB